MNHRDSQLKGRLRLRHLLETTEAVGEEMDVERKRFDRLRDDSSKTRVVSSFNLFQTPPELADMLATMLPLEGRLLEPSAGLGRLYRAVRYRSDCHVTLVEISPECCRELFLETQADENSTLIQGDFLECDASRLGGLFDAVLMNPPFKMGMDRKHIDHARRFLNPGGNLVSLCAAGSRQRKWFEGLENAEWIDLPAGTFRSEGTNVAAAIVKIRA